MHVISNALITVVSNTGGMDATSSPDAFNALVRVPLMSSIAGACIAAFSSSRPSRRSPIPVLQLRIGGGALPGTMEIKQCEKQYSLFLRLYVYTVIGRCILVAGWRVVCTRTATLLDWKYHV